MLPGLVESVAGCFLQLMMVISW